MSIILLIDDPGLNHTLMTAIDRPDKCGRNEPGSNRHTKTLEISVDRGFLSLSGAEKKKKMTPDLSTAVATTININTAVYEEGTGTTWA